MSDSRKEPRKEGRASLRLERLVARIAQLIPPTLELSLSPHRPRILTSHPLRQSRPPSARPPRPPRTSAPEARLSRSPPAHSLVPLHPVTPLATRMSPATRWAAPHRSGCRVYRCTGGWRVGARDGGLEDRRVRWGGVGGGGLCRRRGRGRRLRVFAVDDCTQTDRT